MKYAVIILSAIVLILSWLLWEQNQIGNIEINDLKKKVEFHESNADSLQSRGEVLKDSLKVAIDSIKVTRAEKDRAHKETAILKKKYESIRVIHYATNDQRDSVVRDLYPTVNLWAYPKYPVPEPVFDTLIHETIRGRACEGVVIAQGDELQKQGKELLQTNEALRLSQDASEVQEKRGDELEKALDGQKDLTDKVGKKERKRGRKEGLLGGAGGVALIVLILLL